MPSLDILPHSQGLFPAHPDIMNHLRNDRRIIIPANCRIIRLPENLLRNLRIGCHRNTILRVRRCQLRVNLLKVIGCNQDKSILTKLLQRLIQRQDWILAIIKATQLPVPALWLSIYPRRCAPRPASIRNSPIRSPWMPAPKQKTFLELRNAKKVRQVMGDNLFKASPPKR